MRLRSLPCPAFESSFPQLPGFFQSRKTHGNRAIVALILNMVLVTKNKPLSLELDEWTLCWEVNLPFRDQMWYKLDCFSCGKTQVPSYYHSTFLRDATTCGKGHFWCDWAKIGSCICNICDKDIVLDVTKREKKCFIEGCESLLNVTIDVVEGKIDDEDLFGK